MTRYWFASLTVLLGMTGGALAQSPSFDATNSTQPNLSTNGPAGTYDMTKTKRVIEGGGAETDTIESFHKSQSYTSGDGTLSARTNIETLGPAMTAAPSPNLPKESIK